MAKTSRLSKRQLSRALSLISCAALTAGCSSIDPPKIDPCQAFWEVSEGKPPFLDAHCVPLNQPGKPEYDRPIAAEDVCVKSEEYAALQKFMRDVIRECGDRCK